MRFIQKFTFLTKDELPRAAKTTQPRVWVIDQNKFLTEIEIAQLRRYSLKIKRRGILAGNFKDIRDWFMIELGLNTGLRVSEMANLRRQDILIDNGRASITVTGKGNKTRTILISEFFANECKDHFALKRRFGFSIDEGSFVLNNPKDKKIHKRTLQKSFKQIVNRSGLPKHHHIHNLRHTYATFLLRASNYNYRFVQRQLGHSSIRTTQIYAGVIESEGKKALEQLYNSD